MLPKRPKPQRGAGDWRPSFPDRPPQFNRDIQALVPRWQAEHATEAPTSEDYYAWIQTQPEWATLKRGDISVSAVQEKARQATAQAFKDDAQRATPDEIGRQRYGEAWDTYSAETKRGLAIAPVFKKVGEEVSKKNPLLGAIIPGLADPIIYNGLQAIYTFLIEGGVEIAKALLRGDPKSALIAIAKKSAPAFMQAFTASRQDPTPLALKLREVAEQIAGHEGEGVISDISHFLTGKYQGEKAMEKTLHTYGEARIMQIRIFREPVRGALAKVVDWFTAGDLQRQMQKNAYDKLFHLSMLISLSTGVDITMEKNAAVTTHVGKLQYGVEAQSVVAFSGQGPELRTFVYNSIQRAGANDFWVYDAFGKNCQDFIYNCLQANTMMTPAVGDFIRQNLLDVASKHPTSAKFFTALTDISGVLTGGGMLHRTITGDHRYHRSRKHLR